MGEIAIEELAERRGRFIASLLRDNARPSLPVNSFRAAIPSFDLLDSYHLADGTNNPSVATCSEMASWNGQIGLLVASETGYSGNIAKDIAQTIYALDLGAQHCGCIVSLIKNNLELDDAREKSTIFDPRVAEELGIDIIYDIDNIFGTGSIDKTGGVIITQDHHIVVKSEEPQHNPKVECFLHGKRLEAIINQMNRYRSYDSSYRMNFYGQQHEKSGVNITKDNLRQIVSQLTFGRWGLEELPKERDDKVIGYHLPLQRGSSIMDLNEADLLKKINDICLLWKYCFFENGVSFDVCKIATANTFSSLGKATGTDIAIQAYFDGVPIEDIIIED